MFESLFGASDAQVPAELDGDSENKSRRKPVETPLPTVDITSEEESE